MVDMKSLRHGGWGLVFLGIAMGAGGGAAAWGADWQFSGVERTPRGEVRLRLLGAAGSHYRLETSTNLLDWSTLATARATATNEHTDTRRLGVSAFYRAVGLAEAPFLTGDHVATERGDVVLRPVNHAAVVLGWEGTAVYVDPAAGGYDGLPKADVVLITHSHGDHFNVATVNSVSKTNAVVVAPQAVFSSLPAAMRARTVVLTNGATATLGALQVEAVPAYNANHPRGSGNGYVVTAGGRRFYFSGDTGNTPEMRALSDIDVAFLCMNLPFTMTVNDATNAVRAFLPRVVYPYHYRDQSGSQANAAMFRDRLGTDTGVEVRLRSWY